MSTIMNRHSRETIVRGVESAKIIRMWVETSMVLFTALKQYTCVTRTVRWICVQGNDQNSEKSLKHTERNSKSYRSNLLQSL